MTTEPPPSLSQFLVDNKRRFLEDLKKDAGAKWTIVMGNEAGDLDTIASSVAYSFLAQPSLTVALLQLNRQDLSLRPENLYALDLVHLDPTHADLLCLDDLPIPPSKIMSSVALVDHNELEPTFESTDPSKPRKVVAVIDHHEDEKLYPDAKPRIVVPGVGSCSSLVTNHFKDSWATLQPPAEVASLLITAMAIDTNGLEEGGKAKAQDHEAFNFLLPNSTFAPLKPGEVLPEGAEPPMPVDVLTKELKTRKLDVSHLSTRDLLRRDFKDYDLGPPAAAPVRLGLSTVPISIEDCLEKDPAPSFSKALDAFLKERNLDFVGVLNSFKSKKGKDRRQIIVFDSGKDHKLRHKLYTGLEASTVLELEALEVEGLTDKHGKGTQIRSWTQGNNKASRKLIAPVFQEILDAA